MDIIFFFPTTHHLAPLVAQTTQPDSERLQKFQRVVAVLSYSDQLMASMVEAKIMVQ